ncbi:MAG: hypothetical protein SF053_17960 [Bacteroidia bacterium]|nr:hypothetical protein [Bacteroidia bacterium]
MMQPSPPLSYDSIRDLRHSLSPTDDLYLKADLIWMSMTDWVTAVKDFDDFLRILHKEIGAELTRENINKHRRGYGVKKSIPLSSWKGESLIELEFLFDQYPEVQTLAEMFGVLAVELTQKYAEMKGLSGE